MAFSFNHARLKGKCVVGKEKKSPVMDYLRRNGGAFGRVLSMHNDFSHLR